MPVIRALGEQVTYDWSYAFSPDTNTPHPDDLIPGKPPERVLPLLVIYERNTHVLLHCRTVRFDAKVKLEDDSMITQLGFCNTIYRSERKWYYTDKTLLKELIASPPVWDGDEDEGEVCPWYNGLCYEVEDGDFTGQDGDDVSFTDAPRLPPYQGTRPENGVPFGSLSLRGGGKLFFIEGIDSYECFLVVAKDNQFEVVDSVRWGVSFEAVIHDGRATSTSQMSISIDDGGQSRFVQGGRSSVKSKVFLSDKWERSDLSTMAQHALRRAAY